MHESIPFRLDRDRGLCHVTCAPTCVAWRRSWISLLHCTEHGSDPAWAMGTHYSWEHPSHATIREVLTSCTCFFLGKEQPARGSLIFCTITPCPPSCGFSDTLLSALHAWSRKLTTRDVSPPSVGSTFGLQAIARGLGHPPESMGTGVG